MNNIARYNKQRKQAAKRRNQANSKPYKVITADKDNASNIVEIKRFQTLISAEAYKSVVNTDLFQAWID